MEFKIKSKELQDVFKTTMKIGRIIGWSADKLFIKATSNNKVYFGLRHPHDNGILIEKDAEVKEEGSTVVILDTENPISPFNRIKKVEWKDIDEWTIKKIGSTKITIDGTEFDYPLNILSFVSENIIMEMELDNREDTLLENWEGFLSSKKHLLIKMDAIELKYMLRQALKCIDPYEVRRSMRGVFLRINKSHLVMTGTNGVKLFETAKPHYGSVSEERKFILTYHAGKLLKKVLKEGIVEISMDEKKEYLIFETDNTLVRGGLILGDKYPEYDPLFNGSVENSFKMPLPILNEKAVSMAKHADKSDNYRMTILAENNRLNIGVDDLFRTTDIGTEGRIDLDINGVFLLDLLKNMDGEMVEIRHSFGKNLITFHPDKNGQRGLLTTIKRRNW